MFEKLSQAAEQMATGASRRQFLGRFGGAATALAAAVGALLAQPAVARGGNFVCDASSADGCAGKTVQSKCLVACGTGSVNGHCKSFIHGSTGCYCEATTSGAC